MRVVLIFIVFSTIMTLSSQRNILIGKYTWSKCKTILNTPIAYSISLRICTIVRYESLNIFTRKFIILALNIVFANDELFICLIALSVMFLKFCWNICLQICDCFDEQNSFLNFNLKTNYILYNYINL